MHHRSMRDEHTARVAAAVRAEMARAGVTQTALAAHLDLTQQAVSRRITGAVPFTVPELLTVAEVLAVPITALTGQPEEAAAR